MSVVVCAHSMVAAAMANCGWEVRLQFVVIVDSAFQMVKYFLRSGDVVSRYESISPSGRLSTRKQDSSAVIFVSFIPVKPFMLVWQWR